MTCAALGLAFATAPAQPKQDVATQPFGVQVLLTPAANAELTSRGEQLRVFGYYFGVQKLGVATQMGEVDLHSSFDVQDLPLPGIVTVPSKHLDAAGLQKSKGTMLLVNVVSARKSSKDNLLSCDIYEGPIPKTTSQLMKLHCGLIAEGLTTKMINSF